MKTRGRTIFLSMMLIASLSVSLIPIFPGTHSYAASTPPPVNFIVPVTPVTVVPDGYMGITSAEELDAVRNDLDGQYILMNDIVINRTNWPDFPPIGASEADAFTGIFDGNGKTISGLVQKISYPTPDEYSYASGIVGINHGVVNSLGIELCTK